ncbi:MAG: isoprenylcysteine carboxylmethyltransferase family protein [Alphaproteobacteria bacterium]|nr:isoprenylcysteine carboxylmethyltransferase family protein [Alphaproteobacteria bacterium]
MQSRPNSHHWPPYLYALTMAAALGLTWGWPLAFWALPLQRWLGALLFAGGIVMGLAAIGLFRKMGTTVDPTGRASALADRGIYRFTRNPMYLGATLAYLGLGLWFGNGWLLLLTPIMALGLHHLAILREEAWLSARFGPAYVAYCARVRRWI